MEKAREALPSALRFAGHLMIIAGVLHCLSWIVSGWSNTAMTLMVFGILYLIIGAALHYRVPKVRYPALLIVLIGALGAYITMNGAQITQWLSQLFIVIDLVVIALLAASIWRGRQTA